MSKAISEFEYRVPEKNLESIKKTILYKLIFIVGVDPKNALPRHWLNAAMFSVRDLITENWLVTRRCHIENDKRLVYYLSMEFLIGRAFINSVINQRVYDLYKQALEELGQELETAKHKRFRKAS